MHYSQRENSGRDIVEHDSSAFWKSFQLPHRRRLDNIECSKKYKTREKSFPRERNGDQGDQLACDFVDHDKLRIFRCRGPRHSSGSGNAHQRDQRGQSDCDRSAQRGCQRVCNSGPDNYRGSGCPGPGPGTQVADSEESCDHRCPERGARAGPFDFAQGRLRDSRRDAAATVRGRGLHASSSWSSGVRSLIPSSVSAVGDEIT